MVLKVSAFEMLFELHFDPLLSLISEPFWTTFGPFWCSIFILLELNFDPFDVHVGHTDALHRHFLGAGHLLVIDPSQMHLG